MGPVNTLLIPRETFSKACGVWDQRSGGSRLLLHSDFCLVFILSLIIVFNRRIFVSCLAFLSNSIFFFGFVCVDLLLRFLGILSIIDQKGILYPSLNYKHFSHITIASLEQGNRVALIPNMSKYSKLKIQCYSTQATTIVPTTEITLDFIEWLRGFVDGEGHFYINKKTETTFSFRF